MGRQFLICTVISVIVILNAGFGGVGGAEKTPRLLFANRKDIRLMDTGTKKGNSTIVVRDLVEATSVDVNLKSETICWSDIKAEKIQCQKHGRVTTLVSTSLPAPEDIAIDCLTNKLYWTDSENNHIEVVCLDSKLRKVLIWEDIDQPRAIVLDTNVRTMFWSDWGENPKIERASMDGTNRRPIIDKDIFWPNGIALDYRNKILYWVDAKLHYIASVDYNGSNRKLINQDGPLHPFMMAYYQNVLYWSDWHTNSLHSIRVDTNQIRTLPTKSNITPMDLVIFEEPDKPKETNPCADAKCSHICLLSESTRGFKCACPVGVKLLKDGTICNDDIESFLIVARGTDIRRISLDTTDYTDVLMGFTGIKHLLTVDYWNGSVFWTDDEARKIRSGSLKTFETTDIIKEELVHPDSLAVDWVGQNLYWTDAGTDRIEVAKLNGKFRKILISRGLTEPRAIGLDPKRGLMFWSDWGKKPRIERSNMDGSNRESVITENIFWPNGLALDNGVLYWCDAKSDKIELADYDGKNRRELLTQDLPHTFGFSLLGDYIYWTDWQRRTVERAEKTTGHDRTVIKEQFMDPMGIVAVSPKSYNYTLNPCHWQINNFCQHLCLFNGDFNKVSHCACASGYELSQDNKSCTNPEAFILYSNSGEIHRISLNQSRSDVIPVKAKSPSALDYDSFESRIYWADSKLNSINRAYMNGSDTERLVDYGIKHPEGLAVDWLNRNMYWTDMGRNRIEVAKLNGDFRRTIIWDNIDSPRSIIVQPNKAWLYWSSWSTENPGIEKSSLDGTKRIPLVKGIGRAYGLALDSDFLYWSDIDNFIIERLHLGSNQRNVIVSAEQMYRPFSIASYQSWLYWQDTESSTIYRLPTNYTRNFTVQKVHSNMKSIQELKIYDKLKQSKTTWTPCSVLNCSHLCFTVQGKTLNSVCGCPNHYVLRSNENICLAPEEYLLFSSTNAISRFLDFDSVIFGGLKNVTGVSADRHFVYVLSDGIVKRYKLEDPGDGTGGSGISVLAKNVTYFVLHGRLILFASANCINVSSMEGNYVGVVYCAEKAEDTIQYLKIYKSYIYFVGPKSIERVTMNGIERLIIINATVVTPMGLEIDEDLLYWSEGEQIFVSNLLGTSVKVLGSNTLGGPKNLAILGRFIYWIDSSGGVERMDKFTGLERARVVPRSEDVTSIVYVNLPQQEDCDPDCTICTSSEACTCPMSQILAQDGKRCLTRQDCPVGHFQCASGHIGCIPAANQCNGIKECQDASDETDCFVCTGDQCRLSGCKPGESCPPEAISSAFDLTYLLIPVVLFICIVGTVYIALMRRKKALRNAPSTSGSCAMNMSSTTTTHLHHHAYPLDTAVAQPPVKYTNNSSSSSSNYNELLVPHPSPVTTTHSYCCSHGNNAKKYYYLQSKELNMGPCPTPCSTDVCDNSDIYNFSFNAPPPSITSSPNSTLRMHFQI
ncbi:unnamed protein product [Allacma fusca]|uniref:EGF-like domain-containing protein n=1 Tax=Allacma fusca TaxID=39272 RepID=A0A8J2KIV5_9HEXA|nr:unnamed protein product [Allacma fusca]